MKEPKALVEGTCLSLTQSDIEVIATCLCAIPLLRNDDYFQELRPNLFTDSEIEQRFFDQASVLYAILKRFKIPPPPTEK